MTDRHIVATSSGGFHLDDRYGARPGPLMELCRALSGADAPRVCALHTATGDDEAFDTGDLDLDEQGEVTFDEPGSYPYYCRFHAFMRGTVEVE